MRLYDLAENYRSLVAEIETYDLEPQTLLDTLEGSTQLMSIEEKAGNIVKMAKNWESDLPGLEAEIKRLTDRKKAIENRVKGIKEYLKSGMELAGIYKIKVDNFTISLQDNQPSLVINNPNLIPAEYQMVKYDIDSTKIKYYLKEGKEIPGASLVVGRSLRIR